MQSSNEINKEPSYCLCCGSLLGKDCGDAEPDYNEQLCSKICYENSKQDQLEDYNPRLWKNDFNK